MSTELDSIYEEEGRIITLFGQELSDIQGSLRVVIYAIKLEEIKLQCHFAVARMMQNSFDFHRLNNHSLLLLGIGIGIYICVRVHSC